MHFEKEIYLQRRQALKTAVGKGLLLFHGNSDSPMNYRANTYTFRQDSNFLYFFGLDKPGLNAVMDIDNNREIIYGDDIDIDDIIWMGEQPSLAEMAAGVGITETRSASRLKTDVEDALKKNVRPQLLPPYRGEHLVFLSGLLGVAPDSVKDFVSPAFIQAVVALREIKDEQEILQLEYAIDVAYRMHTTMMRMAFPGTWEREIAGMVEGVALANGGPVSFPVILSMDGQTLHNHHHGNLLAENRLLVCDAGAESPLHYASDITRTAPVGGRFNPMQKEVYEIVLNTNLQAINSVRPGITNRELHLAAALTIANGLKSLGLMKGNMQDAVAAGAHALFFPHGLGHMLGLDVHDMESLGENYVGYNSTVERSQQFGLAYLRLAKKLKPGFVLTIEPGIYFIPALVSMWKEKGLHKDFINYDKLEPYMALGGIRIEDDVLVTGTSHRVLGKPIPKTVAEVEDFMNA
jgi:Xaa-Pro aminopeptidase